MAGNVDEWVNDWYSESYYQYSPMREPTGPDSGTFRVVRGGSWLSNNVSNRSAFRFWVNIGYQSDNFGFRCVSSP
jgi:formylglycine-generating enzyme required for sulfatase activity